MEFGRGADGREESGASSFIRKGKWVVTSRDDPAGQPEMSHKGSGNSAAKGLGGRGNLAMDGQKMLRSKNIYL